MRWKLYCYLLNCNNNVENNCELEICDISLDCNGRCMSMQFDNETDEALVRPT